MVIRVNTDGIILKITGAKTIDRVINCRGSEDLEQEVLNTLKAGVLGILMVHVGT